MSELVKQEPLKHNPSKADLFLRLLVNKYFTGKQDLLAKILPKEELESLHATGTPLKDPHLILFDSTKWLYLCDPSWYVSCLKALPQGLQELYLQILPEEHVQAFCTAERIEKKEPATSFVLSAPIKQFLLGFLYRHWTEKEPLAKEFIDSSTLTPLLELKKAELLSVIDLLSMHLLVDEVRHIVDKRILHALSQLLTVPQQQYLRNCLRQKTKHHAPTFSLKEQLKEPKKLLSMLHKQGLKRLAIALSGENKDFIWHILHTLDCARAKFVQADIQKDIQTEPMREITKQAQSELLQILQFLKTSTKT